MMAKTICDWSKKDLEAKGAELAALVHEACFYCRKCGRSANTKKVLCKATPLPEPTVPAQKKR